MPRAEIVIRDLYHEFRERLNFLEDVAQVLKLVPPDILEEERLAILPKGELEEAVKSRTRELESTLAQLRDEKRKLSQALANLEALDRAKSDFITVVSHQFRTPLSIIRWSSEVLADEISRRITGEKKGALLEYTQAVHEKVLFLTSMLDDVYDALGIEGSEIEAVKKPGQLWEVIEDVVKEFTLEAKRKKVEIIFDRTKVPIEEIQLDKDKIRRVAQILLRNAVQYTPHDGKVTVIIRGTDLKGKPALACSVQDTGIGIAKEDISNLFTKFFRAKNAIAMAPDGAGLGLYLVKRFVEAHGGTIAVESEPDRGSMFTFVLPKS
jgi:signal transduction histidine kinase